MKRCFLLIAWLAYVLPSMTQTNGSPIEQSVLTAMSQLSYDSLRTGIHIDRVPQYLPVKAFDGTLPSDSIEVTWNALSLIYSMLAWSQVDTFPLTLKQSTAPSCAKLDPRQSDAFIYILIQILSASLQPPFGLDLDPISAHFQRWGTPSFSGKSGIPPSIFRKSWKAP